MFGLPRGWDMLIILAVILLVFGNRLPGLGKSLGQGIVEFKKGLAGKKDDDEVSREVTESGRIESKPASPAAPATNKEKLEA
jgi:sec-independent protein translocase protein TatA